MEQSSTLVCTKVKAPSILANKQETTFIINNTHMHAIFMRVYRDANSTSHKFYSILELIVIFYLNHMASLDTA